MQDKKRRLQSAKETVRRGVLPKYLVQYKLEEEEERKQCLAEIELNKKPSGTKRLVQKDIDEVRSNLKKEK